MILCFRSQGYKTFDKKNSFHFLEKTESPSTNFETPLPQETREPERRQSRPPSTLSSGGSWPVACRSLAGRFRSFWGPTGPAHFFWQWQILHIFFFLWQQWLLIVFSVLIYKRSTCGLLRQTSVCPKARAKKGTCRAQRVQRWVTWEDRAGARPPTPRLWSTLLRISNSRAALSFMVQRSQQASAILDSHIF